MAMNPDDGGIDHGVCMSGSSETASSIRLKTSALTQSRQRLKTVLQCPNDTGKSRHGRPVRAIHRTASTNSRGSPPVRPGSVGLPRPKGTIFSHCASERLNRSMANSFRSLNHKPRGRGKPLILNRPSFINALSRSKQCDALKLQAFQIGTFGKQITTRPRRLSAPGPSRPATPPRAASPRPAAARDRPSRRPRHAPGRPAPFQ